MILTLFSKSPVHLDDRTRRTSLCVLASDHWLFLKISISRLGTGQSELCEYDQNSNVLEPLVIFGMFIFCFPIFRKLFSRSFV